MDVVLNTMLRPSSTSMGKRKNPALFQIIRATRSCELSSKVQEAPVKIDAAFESVSSRSSVAFPKWMC